MPRLAPPLVAAVAALFLTRHAVIAQQTQGQIAVGGGIATDARGVTSHAVTISPTLSGMPDPRLTLGFGGSATRFENEQWSAGGNASSAGRAPLASVLALTVNAAVSVTGTSYNASYATLDAIPAAELHLGPVTALGGAHV